MKCFLDFLREDSSLPAGVASALFAQGLTPERMRANAVRMVSSLDAAHTADTAWEANISRLERALDGMPLIHTTSPSAAGKMLKYGILPTATLRTNDIGGWQGMNFEFDRLSGLDRTVFLRQGQPGGHGTIGVIVDIGRLDSEKFIVTKLGLMTLKQDEDEVLKQPGDHTDLINQQLTDYRASTILYRDMNRVQARLLMDGFLKDHPEAANRSCDVDEVVRYGRGEMEVKYAGDIPPTAILGFLVGSEGALRADTLRAGIPDSAIISYTGGPDGLADAYRQRFLRV
jgi:hypothetical protein